MATSSLARTTVSVVMAAGLESSPQGNRAGARRNDEAVICIRVQGRMPRHPASYNPALAGRPAYTDGARVNDPPRRSVCPPPLPCKREEQGMGKLLAMLVVTAFAWMQAPASAQD